MRRFKGGAAAVLLALAIVPGTAQAAPALSHSTYLGGDADEGANGIAVDRNGFAYVAGGTVSSDFDLASPFMADAPETDAFVAKVGPAGSNLSFSTYLGGAGTDAATDVAVDAAGNVYVTGTTNSADFPIRGGFSGDEGGIDGFVAKFSPRGELVYSTYLGGSAGDFPKGIEVDATGAAYVTGQTASEDFDLVNPIEDNGAGDDVFVSKIDRSGAGLVYSTYLGGNADESAEDIALDGDEAIIAGTTLSPNFTETLPVDAYEPGDSNAFAAKLNSNGSATVFSTYLAGSGQDEGEAVAVDVAGAIYVAGSTQSKDFETVEQFEGNSGARDGFVVKLVEAGTSRIYSTYLGGGLGDRIVGIAVDPTGAAYVAGTTASSDFDLASPIENNSAEDDVFVSKIATSGKLLDYSTYLGGSGNDIAAGLALDPFDSVHVAGRTTSSDFDLKRPIEGDGGADDAFVFKLDDTPPQTRITKSPPATITTRKRSVRVRLKFLSPEPAVRFRCKLDRRKARGCSSPESFRLGPGRHRILIRAIDAAGQRDPTPARAFVTVKRRG